MISTRRVVSRALAISLAFGLACIGAAVRAQAQSVDPYHSIGLQWTATGDDSTTGRATSYQLKFSTTDPGAGSLDTWWNAAGTSSWTSLPTPSAAGSTDSTRVGSLASGTTYYFVLRALDEVGNISPYSNVASATTASCAAPTAAPSGFAADTLGLSVVLTWNGPADPLATSLHIYRGTGANGTLSLYQTLNNTALTTYTDTNVTAGRTYRYRIAWAAACDEGPSSATLSVRTAGTQPPPDPTVTASSASLHAYPNPVKSGDALQVVITISGDSPQPVRLRLFDLRGRWVADIANGDFAPGENTISWTRVGRHGDAIAPGYYEILGTAGGRKLRERILLLP